MPVFDPTRAASGPHAPSGEACVGVLASFVRDCLAAHDADFARDGRVATYLRAEAELSDAGLAADAMGDPARYAEVSEHRDLGETDPAPGATVRRQLAVGLYWGCQDAAGRALPNAADAAAFRQLVSGTPGAARPVGLVPALRRQRDLVGEDADGATVALFVESVTVGALDPVPYADLAGAVGYRYEANVLLTVTT